MENYDKDGLLHGDDARCKILCKMERIIAEHVSTTNYVMDHYRYPVKYKRNGIKYKCPTEVRNADYDVVGSMQYEFGSHHVDIGDALIEILEFIEDLSNESGCYGMFDVWDRDAEYTWKY